MLARLAHVVARHRWKVIGAWIVLTLFGMFAAAKVHNRWYQSFSIPGYSAYETNQRTLQEFGTGIRPPDVVVFHSSGDATQNPAIDAAITTDDRQASYDELAARGVEFTEEPESRPYGIDAGFRDPSGNRFRLTQLSEEFVPA